MTDDIVELSTKNDALKNQVLMMKNGSKIQKQNF